MDSKHLQDLRVVDLKKELDVRGLSKSGSKKELVDRLKSFIETEEQTGHTIGGTEEQAPPLELQGDAQNEFVKSYLQQRQKLLSQQMEQRKRYEEETSQSQSECEVDDGVSSPERHEQREHVTMAVASMQKTFDAAAENEDSGDSTDVDMPSYVAGDQPALAAESVEHQLPNLDVYNAADGFRHVDIAVESKTEEPASPSKEAPAASPSDLSSGYLRMDGDGKKPVDPQKPVLESKPPSDQIATPTDTRLPDLEKSESKLPGCHRSRSSSASSKHETRSRGQQQSRSRSGSRSDRSSRSRSHSTVHSSRSRSRSLSRDKGKSRSRSSSVEEGHNKKVTKEQHRRRSPSSVEGRRPGSIDRDRSRSRSSSVEREEHLHHEDERSQSCSSSVEKSASVSEVNQSQSVNEDDSIHAETTSAELVHPVELMVEESQQSIDSRLETDRSTVDMKEKPSSASLVGPDKMASAISVAADKTAGEVIAPAATFSATKPVRKRKWGSTAIKESKTIDISTDSLKGLGLEISADAIAAEVPMEVEHESVNGGDMEDGQIPSSPQRTTVEKSESDTRATKIRRIVYKDETVTEIENDAVQRKTVTKMEAETPKVDKSSGDGSGITQETADVESKTPSSGGEPAKVSRSISLKVGDQAATVIRSVSLTVEDPIDVGRRAPSPPRRPPSNVIHVTGLVRPYTLGQLKELLGRTGTLVPDGFWIDGIKSHCYVTYETVEQAIATREALHGKRWPASNPKFLGVEFRTTEELEFRKNNNTGARPAAKHVSEQPLAGAADAVKEPEKSRLGREPRSDAGKDTAKLSRDAVKSLLPKEVKEKVTTPPQVPLREWDRHKLKQSRSKSRERRQKDDRNKVERDRKESDRRREQRDRQKEDRRPRERADKPAVAAKVEDEPPAKLLDDLFRKTKAAPSIYWLPLTDEQVAEKMTEEKERAAVKERLRIEREQEMEAERQQRQKAREERERARDAERSTRPSNLF